MCWMTVLLAMYLYDGGVFSASVEVEVLSIRDLRMVCCEGVSMWVRGRDRFC
jgi:hypothetical protein